MDIKNHYLSDLGINVTNFPAGPTRTYLETGNRQDIKEYIILSSYEALTTGGGGGGSLPDGGLRGQLLVKQSSVNGAALWEDLILSAGGA